MHTEIPIQSHPALPDGVPLVASFHDDRNRLSYYYPILDQLDGVRVPVTKFFAVGGSTESHLDIEYRDITQFMQDIQTQEAFVRSDFSSAKYNGDDGSRITSQDPYDIETVVLELVRQLNRQKRWLGGRIAVREWLPHDREVRYFIRDGKIVYRGCVDGDGEYPDEMAARIATGFQTFAWSADLIRHEETGKWYCIDMGLDGLHAPEGVDEQWIAISEHIDPEQSPEKFIDEMPSPQRFDYYK